MQKAVLDDESGCKPVQTLTVGEFPQEGESYGGVQPILKK